MTATQTQTETDTSFTIWTWPLLGECSQHHNVKTSHFNFKERIIMQHPLNGAGTHLRVPTFTAK